MRASGWDELQHGPRHCMVRTRCLFLAQVAGEAHILLGSTDTSPIRKKCRNAAAASRIMPGTCKTIGKCLYCRDIEWNIISFNQDLSVEYVRKVLTLRESYTHGQCTEVSARRGLILSRSRALIKCDRDTSFDNTIYGLSTLYRADIWPFQISLQLNPPASSSLMEFLDVLT